MKSRINPRHLKKVVVHFIISPEFAAMLLLAIVGTEYGINRPVFIELLQMGVILGGALALSMSMIVATLSTITAKLLVQKRYFLVCCAITLSTGFFMIIFAAYKEMKKMKIQDPLTELLGGAQNPIDSEQHLLVLALVMILWGVSVLIHFLLYSDETKQGLTISSLRMSTLGRLFQFRLVILEEIYNRLREQPQVIAQNRVRGQLNDLETKAWGLRKELKKLRGHRRYELQVLANAKRRVDAGIDAMYSDNK